MSLFQNHNFIPYLNVGNALRQIKDPGGDYDIFDRLSDKGGVRNPSGKTFMGIGIQPQPISPINESLGGGIKTIGEPAGKPEGQITVSDPNASGSGAPTWQQRYFQGQLYTDPDSYKNALGSYATNKFNQNKKEIERQYQAGLINYDELQRNLDLNRRNVMEERDQLLGDTSAYFSRIGTDAFQSQQGAREGKIQRGFDEGNKSLDFQQGQLSRGREDLGNWKNDTLQNEQEAYQNNIDSYANDLLGFKSAQGSYQPKVSTIDRVDLIGNVGGFINNAMKLGLNSADAQAYANRSLTSQGVDPKEAQYAINYYMNNVQDKMLGL